MESVQALPGHALCQELTASSLNVMRFNAASVPVDDGALTGLPIQRQK